MNAGKIIFYILANSAPITAALGTSSVNVAHKKVYRIIAPQRETAPFITYQQVGEVPDQSAQGLKVRTPFFQVSVWATTPDIADTISELCITALDNVSGTVDSLKFDNILYTNNQETIEPNLDPPLYGRLLEFQIRISL